MNNLKKILIFIVLFAAVCWAGKGIFKYSVFSTHDLDHHLARSFDAVKTFSEGHFPMRWAGSLNYFCGVPVYNFFYPLIYYLVVLINYSGFDIITFLKIIDFASLLIGTIFFYLWMKVETKKYIPALGGSLLYLYAPYRFSLIFVRGSPEFLAYAILPVVLYFYALFFDSENKKSLYFAFLASLSGAFLAISHNFTVMFVFPIILIYLTVKSILQKINISKIYLTAFSFLASFGMSAFFIGPAVLEKRFTKIGENFLFWKEHFPTLGQLIKSPWGYFYSSLGTANDGMSFMLGYAHWLVLGIAGIWIIYRLVFKRKLDLWVVLTFIASIVTIYLILPWSIPVWEVVKPLQEIQFSWRLLGIAIFTISALFAFMLDKIDSRHLLIPVFIGVVFLALYGNRNHLLPQPVSVQDLYRYDDFETLHYHRYSTTTLGDDIIAKEAPKACWFDVPLVSTDVEKVEYKADRGNTYGFVKFKLPKKVKGKLLTTGLGFFPGAYKFEINGSGSSYNNCNGRTCFDISKFHEGENYISWKIVQTPIESFFNYVSLAFIITWLVVLFGGRKLKPYFLLIIILSVFVFFRTYNLTGRIGFGWDQERDANAAASILSGDLTLLGPRVQGPAGFFLPPYFFYLIAPFYKISNLSPFAMNLFISFSALSTFIAGFFILSKVFSKNLALIFLAIWAVNPLAISIDTIAWNPIVVPSLFLILIYLIDVFFEKNKLSYLFYLGLVFGLGISFHLQFLFIFPIFIPLAYDLLKSKQVKKFIWFLVGVVIPSFPILLFDLRHDFLNTKQMIEFIGQTDSANRVFVVWQRISSFMVGGEASNILGLLVYLFVCLGYLFSFRIPRKKGQSMVLLGLGLVWAIGLPLFYLFIKNPSEYYFNYLLVPLVILLAYLLNLWRKTGFVLLTITIIYFSYRALPLLRNVNLNLREKDHVISILSKITKGTEPFNISFDVPLNEDTGFRYLLKYYNVAATGDTNDPLIEFVIPGGTKKDTFTIGQIGVSIPDSWISRNYLR